MRTRTIVIAALLVGAMLLPGCPGMQSALVGTWIITQVGGVKYGLELNADGTADPFTVDGFLDGTFTWEAEGTRVLFHQITTNNNQIVWAALLVSDTNLSGAWVVWNGTDYGDSTTWSAAKQ